MDYLAEFHELVDRAEARGYLPETGVLLEDAAKLALKHSDTANAVLARYLYTFAVAPMEPEKALVSFSWCIAHATQAEDMLPAGSLAQLYGIAIGILRSYPTYSLEIIEETFTEMENLYDEYGLARRDIWHQRLYLALSTGRKDQAEVYFRKWQSTESDIFGCPVCDRGTVVLYHLHREEYEQGMSHARPIVDGSVSCAHGQPLMCYAATLVPLIRMGRFDEAEVHFRATRALLRELSYAGIWAAGRQLSYLSLVGEIDEGVDVFDNYFATGMSRGTPADRYGFLIAVKSMVRRVQEDGDASQASRILQSMAFYPSAENSSIESALEWAEDELMAVATAFDERNGNDEFTRIVNLFDDIYENVRTLGDVP